MESLSKASDIEKRKTEFNTGTANKVSWIDRMAMQFVVKILRQLRYGHLTLTYNNQCFSFGDKDTEQVKADIHVNDVQFFRNVFARESLGAGESYMAGHWCSSDLTKVIQLMAMNLNVVQLVGKNRPWYTRFAHSVSLNARRLKTRNTKRQAKENIAAHYDLSNDLFQLFLDPTMMYSSAIFHDESATLEQASVHKVKRLCDKLQLKESDHLLEIGTGWGFLAVYAATHYGCQVTTTTLSKEQFEFANQRVRQQGLEDKITILLQDYRDLEGCYDKLVSVEMIEAVGHDFFDDYFEKCSSLLAEDGLMAIQAITIADQRYDQAVASVDFIQKYIFPGGCLPSNHVVTDCLKRKTDMQLQEFEDIGQHYAKTLRIWRERFFDRIEAVRALGFDQRFIRMWEFYLCYCEGGFLERAISTSQFVFAKPRWRV